MSEHDEQCALFLRLRWALPAVYDVTFAIPNGGHRVKAVAAKMKAEGVRAGVPDVFVAMPRGDFHGLFIELKTLTGRVSKTQMEWLDRLDGQGYAAVVCKGHEAAFRAIQEYTGETDGRRHHPAR